MGDLLRLQRWEGQGQQPGREAALHSGLGSPVSVSYPGPVCPRARCPPSLVCSSV